MTRRSIFSEAAGELFGSGLLVAVVFVSGAVRAQLGTAAIGGALLGSVALGLGYGLVIWSFGALSGAQTNPIVAVIASLFGHQPWGRTLLRVVAQMLGAASMALLVSRIASGTFARDESYAGSGLMAEAVASFAFVLVALGVSHLRDAKVPVALGAIATASLWMTGRATVGNPLLSLTILLVAGGAHATLEVSLLVAGANVAGSALATMVALFLFPRAREAACVLLFVPQSGGR